MKRFLLLLVAISSIMNCVALSVSFKSQKFDGTTYLVMVTNSDDDKVVITPLIVKFYLNDGSSYILDNSSSAKFGKSVELGMGFSSDRSKNYYRFEVNQELRDAIKKGVKGIAINTAPEIYTEKYTEVKSKQLQKLIEEPKETDEL